MVDDALVSYYRNSLRGHAETLDRLAACLDDTDDPGDHSGDPRHQAVHDAVALAHRLRGTGASYGFAEISALAAILDDLADPERPGAATPDSVRAPLEDLRRAVHAAAAPANPGTGSDDV